VAAIRGDVDVRRDVLDALRNDVRIDAANVTVDVVGGVVYLRGTVPSYYQKQTATEDANRIKGVVDVVNELRVAPVTPRTDQEITNDVRAALIRDIRVDETRINVNTINGVVYLSGTVNSYGDKFYADNDAWTVPGVIDVVNNIVVQPVLARTDQDIADDVRRALIRDARVDASRISVDVQNGVVYLRGSVPTVEQKWQASDDAWWTTGVRDVVNELAVIP